VRSREIVVVWDVFVSYRHQDPDGPWVRQVLVERLRAAGLRVLVDVDGFRLGAPLVLEMARGVEESRYTLAVLSPPPIWTATSPSWRASWPSTWGWRPASGVWGRSCASRAGRGWASGPGCGWT
jgi:hypothetical protein